MRNNENNASCPRCQSPFKNNEMDLQKDRTVSDLLEWTDTHFIGTHTTETDDEINQVSAQNITYLHLFFKKDSFKHVEDTNYVVSGLQAYRPFVKSYLFPLKCGACDTIPREGFEVSVVIHHCPSFRC